MTKTASAVHFGSGQTGSTLLRDAMTHAVGRFPAVFGDFTVPEPKQFKRVLPTVFSVFEARRAASADRVDVARELARFVAERAFLDGPNGDRNLVEALKEVAPVPAPHEVKGTAAPGWTPEICWGGRTWRGRQVVDLVKEMRARHILTRPAADALDRVADRWLGAPVDLRGQTFVVLGAAAELAPTPYLLAAGARVLWVDRQAPALEASSFAGTLVHGGSTDLLADPCAIRAAIAAEQGPLHLGLYAYAPGSGRELLLTTVMNALADSVPDGSLASIAMWVSPTTPGEVLPEDRAERAQRRATIPRWQRALARAKVLREPAFVAHGDVEISRSIVPLQGPTYLAAQVFGKRMVAEAWAIDRAPLRVSANVAGITHTRSLEHPLFQAAFLSAPSFGIEIFQPEASRTLSTLLMLHDLLHPDAPTAAPGLAPAERARRLSEQSIHGGVRSAPFEFDPTIRVAAAMGLARRPALILKLARG